ncbi:RDD family protein [Enterovirga rhinocerotis]|uniref:Putative RDD family membrane protein YckC n=1 Tax=Enterovirga rhinocerotis TaxID=1339210 RepID=A0A4R7BIY5_9HYPH|nr:RDD family protein [Enterovirga rhinocerotis]TDR85284.1 putative RDD family membrane protein YckC [Enterovirga rhinocerotis]
MARQLDRINRLLDESTRNRREITTPEGVVLEVDIANRGERLVAFLMDFLFWMLATALLFLILSLTLVHGVSGSVTVTIVLFLSFLLRNLYFIHFELHSQGATPGKRIVNLKVVDRHGGPLLPGAIVARNLTREVEIFLPLGLFFALPKLDGSGDFWAAASYLGWAAALSALPFFNRDHLRAGDLIAGTMVISVPRRALLTDLAEGGSRYVFSRRQLEAYGAFELQVLEELLRRPRSKETQAMQQQVCDKICRKIAWAQKVEPAEVPTFLKAFYTAERAHLEGEQQFGRYRADKNATAATHT